MIRLTTILPKLTPYKALRLLAALSLLAALLAGTPAPARASGAVLCGANRAGMSQAARAQAAEAHQAGLVIDFGDGRVLTFCVDLGDDGQATGEELLRASNLPVILEYSGGIGSAVCKIDTVGSNFPAEPCFSHCTLQPGETCMYWSFSQLVGDHWQFSQVGASSTIVHSGDVNGWAWGISTIAQGAQPPLRTLAEICLPATARPTASLTPTPTATPTATQPPAPPQPATTTPYVAPVITSTPTASPAPTSTPTASSTATPAASTPSASSVQQSTPALATAPAALAEPSAPILMPQPPTPTLSATAAPLATSVGLEDSALVSLPAAAPVNRNAGGSLRIQLALIQHAVVAMPSATVRPAIRPAARVAAALLTPSRTPSAPAAVTPMPFRQAAPEPDTTRNYPYFGGMAAFLLAGWVLLRRGRRSP